MSNNLILIKGGGNNRGKTTVAKMILYLLADEAYKKVYDWSSYNKLYWGGTNGIWSIKSFAKKASDAYKVITGIDYKALSRADKEKERPRFIEFAESQKKIFGEEVWAEALFREYSNDKWIIEDYRFPCENKYIDKNYRGIYSVIGVYKEGDDTRGVENVIMNTGSFDDLLESVEVILKREGLIWPQ